MAKLNIRRESLTGPELEFVLSGLESDRIFGKDKRAVNMGCISEGDIGKLIDAVGPGKAARAGMKLRGEGEQSKRIGTSLLASIACMKSSANYPAHNALLNAGLDDDAAFAAEDALEEVQERNSKLMRGKQKENYWDPLGTVRSHSRISQEGEIEMGLDVSSHKLNSLLVDARTEGIPYGLYMNSSGDGRIRIECRKYHRQYENVEAVCAERGRLFIKSRDEEGNLRFNVWESHQVTKAPMERKIDGDEISRLYPKTAETFGLVMKKRGG